MRQVRIEKIRVLFTTQKRIPVPSNLLNWNYALFPCSCAQEGRLPEDLNPLFGYDVYIPPFSLSPPPPPPRGFQLRNYVKALKFGRHRRE